MLQIAVLHLLTSPKICVLNPISRIYEIYDAIVVIQLNVSLVISTNLNGLNLTLTLLIQNHNSFLSKLWYNYLNMKEYTNTPLNLMPSNRNKCSKHVLSNNFNCFYVNVDLILDIAFHCIGEVTSAQKFFASFRILNLPLGFSRFLFWETFCKKKKLLWWQI